MYYSTLSGHIITIKEGKDTIEYDIQLWLVREDNGEWKPMKEPDFRWVKEQYGIPPDDKQQ